MMKLKEKLSRLALATMVICGAGLFADEAPQEHAKGEVAQAKTEAEQPKKEPEKPKKSKEEVFSPTSIANVSETYGHLVVKSLDNPVLHLNFDSVIKGMQEAKAGKKPPITEQEYEECLGLMQEYVFKDMSEKNLKDANNFMAANAKEKGVVELEKGKLQMIVLQEGQGEMLTENAIPVVHYSGKYLDGTSFGNSRDSGEPISINLKSTIPGFRQGVLGMKVGEKRKLFIHPDLGYGATGQLLPNSLLVFEVELMKINPMTKETAAEASDGDEADDEDYDDDEDDGDDDEEEDSDKVTEAADKK